MVIRYGKKEVKFTAEGKAKKTETPITFKIAAHKGNLETSWGQRLDYDKGDYIVSASPRDKWCVKKDIFEKTYNITSPTKNNKEGTAIKIHQPMFMVAEQDGDLDSIENKEEFYKGDYIMCGVKGEYWVIKKNKFEKTYKIVKL